MSSNVNIQLTGILKNDLISLQKKKVKGVAFETDINPVYKYTRFKPVPLGTNVKQN